MSNGGMRTALDRYARRVWCRGVTIGVTLVIAAWVLWEVWG